MDVQTVSTSFLTNNYQLRSRDFDGCLVDVSDTMRPEHNDQKIMWTSASLVSFLLMYNINEHTEDELRDLLSKNCNTTYGDIPPLTALAWQSRNPLHADRILRMARMLIENGAEPTFVSRISCRSLYTIPDAISLAVFARCVPLLRNLLMYWWPSPVYVLDSVIGRKVEYFKFLFPMLIEFGLPHGKRICSVIETFIENVIQMKLYQENDEGTWQGFLKQMRRKPSSLKQLSRIALRSSIGCSSSSGQELFQKIESLRNRLPPTLHNYVSLRERDEKSGSYNQTT
ncbi:uncharacterized protein LOC135935603 [Cloeon dipterum]|uniref:uncharacterized protein LOC135935603 n=1 Tax=Cloeon dipterum TaxID=197152 RepID=UPI00321FE86D